MSAIIRYIPAISPSLFFSFFFILELNENEIYQSVIKIDKWITIIKIGITVFGFWLQKRVNLPFILLLAIYIQKYINFLALLCKVKNDE